MNRVRLFSSGALFAFALYCALFNKNLPFTLPPWVYAAATVYFAVFPIKDMFGVTTRNTYKGRQFKKYYKPVEALSSAEFEALNRRYNKGAFHTLLFWLAFMAVPGTLYLTGVIGREWIFLFFALSNFAIFFAVFGWCPIHRFFLKTNCCNECRVYNWDSFFQYSFLVFLPNPCTLTLFALGVASLVEWEVMHYRHPERFYKLSNACLSCENCDMEACKKHKKEFFSTRLKEEYRNENKAEIPDGVHNSAGR